MKVNCYPCGYQKEQQCWIYRFLKYLFQQKQSYKNINVLKLSNFIKKRNLGKIQFSGQNFIIIKVEINWFIFWKYKSLLNFISKKNVKNSLLILELLCIAYQFVKWLKSGEQRRPLESCCIHHLGCLPNVGVGWARRSYNWSGGGVIFTGNNLNYS